MNDLPHETIDTLVRQWHADAQAQPAQLADLRTRILASAERERRDAGSVASAAKGRVAKRWLWMAGGVAAALCGIALMLPKHVPGPEIATQAEPIEAPRESQLDPHLLLARAQLFSQMNEVFSGGLAWIAESGGRVELGMAPNPGTRPDGHRPVAIRLVVMDRSLEQSDWRPCWGADLVAGNEERVELKTRDGRGGELTVWAYLLPDGMVAVDTSFQLSADQPQTTYSGVERPGVPQPIVGWKTDGHEYRLFQTVVPLTEEVG